MTAMKSLYMAHSGLRYLVLLVGLVAAVTFLVGLLSQKPPGKGLRILGSAFAGLLDLQGLLGLAMVLMDRTYPALIGHIVMMVMAAVVVHVLLVVNRKRASPGWLLPLAGVVLALLLIVGGILAIGRSPFRSVSLG